MVDSAHTCEHIYPTVRYDLDHYTKTVSVDQWIEAILGITLKKITEWAGYLSFEALLDASTSIMENLREYCEASDETDRYHPWATMINKIISVAPDLIKEPLTFLLTLIFVRNDPVYVQGSEAARKPDVLMLLTSTLSDLDPEKDTQSIDAGSSTVGIEWKQVIGCAEFKSGDTAKLKQIHQALKLAKQKGRDGFVQFSKSAPQNASSTATSTHADGATPAQATSTGSSKRKASSALLSASKRMKTDSRGARAKVPDVPRAHAEQLASYALEILAGTRGTRNHCLQLLVDGERLMLWYYDAGGIIRSEWMDWIHEFPKFAAIIVAFASLDAGGWGIGNIPNLQPPTIPLPNPSSDTISTTPPFPKSLSGYTITMTHRASDGTCQPVKVTFQKEVFIQYSMVGRRTVVYDITTEPQISTKPLVLKMSMQTSTRTHETKFLKEAAEKKVEHLPEVHMWTEASHEWQLSRGVWGRIFPDNKDNKEYEDRSLRLIVFTKYERVEDIISHANMHSIFMQLIDCLHSLRYDAQILHRDISLGNLLYEIRGGEVWLILNDFDLAAKVQHNGLPSSGQSSKHRTGTLPFMAHELLHPANAHSATHYFRHDLESVFLVAVWFMVNTPGSNNKALRAWEEGGLREIYQTKRGIIQDYEDFEALPFDPETLEYYADWIILFRSVFHNGYKALKDSKEKNLVLRSRGQDANPPSTSQIKNQDTLDGAITRDVIFTQLREWEEMNSGRIEGFVRYFH